jgi:hypothetical protein
VTVARELKALPQLRSLTLITPLVVLATFCKPIHHPSVDRLPFRVNS